MVSGVSGVLSIFMVGGVLGVVERFVYILFGGFGWGILGRKLGFYQKVGFRNILLPPLTEKSRNSRKLGFIPKSGF